VDLLRDWIVFQLAIDLVVGAIVLLAPLALLARIPLPVLPKERLAVRMIGLYPAALAVAWAVGARDPAANQPAIWIANAIRVLGGTALLRGATFDPTAPRMLRPMAAGEYAFAAITALLMARAGLAWALPS
jgi:hypothetical protein